MDELRRFLSRHNLTQEEFGAAVGISGPYVSMLLSGKGKPSLSMAKTILGYCRTKEPGLTFDELFGDRTEAA
jgi:transcriptional regulator with XRE-family HTH domain